MLSAVALWLPLFDTSGDRPTRHRRRVVTEHVADDRVRPLDRRQTRIYWSGATALAAIAGARYQNQNSAAAKMTGRQ
jgi:hypothetical protein